MRRALDAARAWYGAGVPLARLRLMRVALGGYSVVYLLTRAGHLVRPIDYPAEAFAPVGIARLLPAPLSSGGVYASWAVACLLAVCFALGRGYRLVAPSFALALLWITTYRHSWGMIFHTDNLWVLHVALIALADAGAAPSRSCPSGGTPESVSGWPLRAMSLVTVASYLVAGLAKLEQSGLAWAGGEVLRQQIAYDALRKIQLGSVHSPLGPWLLPHAWLFGPLSTFSLGAELLAPLALLGGRWCRVWCVSAWLFHAGVLALMAIAFPYPLSGVAFLSFFPLERWRALGAAARRLRTTGRPAAATRSD
jgi:hypothetical protein